VASELGKRIRSAKIGVVWHTTYTGDSFETMKASFGHSIVQHLKHNPNVWMDDANYKDYSGTATFTDTETKEVTAILSKAGTVFSSLKAETLNGISQDTDLLLAVKTFGNAKIRKGEKIDNPTQHVKDLFNWIYDRYQKEIDTKKTEKGKSVQEEKRKKILAFFANHPQNEIAKIFELANYISDAKQLIINKMNQAGHISTFIKTTNGFKVTGVEGFVAIDHLSGGAVKIVDRMEFSKSNFSADVIKGWQR
jgi:2-succinyl-5-enolpyruvyl-6-hydroxy-3-cyclohexene-1-carboxylate synthase